MQNTTPDTLELSEHGRMAINGVLGILNPERDYECTFLTIFDVHPVYMLHWSVMVSGVMPKFIESLPMLRQMSGSEQDMDIQNGFMDAMIRNMDEDGMVYDRSSPDRPWNTGVAYGKKDWDEDYACMAGNGRLLAGLIHWHQVTGDDVWKRRAARTAERMHELAIVRDDIAYYPNPGLGNDFSYPRKSGWTITDPPAGPEEGCEHATLYYLYQPLRGFVRYYQLTGDDRYMELSRKFVNLGMDRKFGGADHDMHKELGAERGHFRRHFHAGLAGVRGLLDYAVVAGDFRLKTFARDAYEWARQHGIHRLGIFSNHWSMGMEGCAIGDMTGLAVALTDAGVGDYWDDVEQYARNGLIEAQMTDKDEMLRVANAGRERPENSGWGGEFDWRFNNNNKGVLAGQEIHDRTPERNVGAYGWIWEASHQLPMLMHCCTANAPQGLYYAWEGIVRLRGDTAEVNMWLNRRSPWVDVFSSLPHEGKLRVVNKTMSRISVRKPGWANASKIRCLIDSKDVRPVWIGNRMVFDGLKGGETIQIETPVKTESAEYSVAYLSLRDTPGPTYACEFRSHTATKVELIRQREGAISPDWYRIFRREHLRTETTPTKSVDGYVHPEKLLKWSVL